MMNTEAIVRLETARVNFNNAIDFVHNTKHFLYVHSIERMAITYAYTLTAVSNDDKLKEKVLPYKHLIKHILDDTKNNVRFMNMIGRSLYKSFMQNLQMYDGLSIEIIQLEKQIKKIEECDDLGLLNSNKFTPLKEFADMLHTLTIHFVCDVALDDPSGYIVTLGTVDKSCRYSVTVWEGDNLRHEFSKAIKDYIEEGRHGR